jgi:hypothetical protein
LAAEDEELGAGSRHELVDLVRGLPEVAAGEQFGLVVHGVLLVSPPPARVVGSAERASAERGRVLELPM